MKKKMIMFKHIQGMFKVFLLSLLVVSANKAKRGSQYHTSNAEWIWSSAW